jgi:hypothetical protein
MDPKQTDGAAFEDMVGNLFDPGVTQDDEQEEDAEEQEEGAAEGDEGEGDDK